MSCIKILAGSSHPEFTKKICQYLKIVPSEMIVTRFADTEIYVKINEKVRGEDVFVIQSTSRPVNDNLMELLIIIDALKRASVDRINVVMPYFGYGRQDRRASAREPITAKLVANLLTKAGATRIITVDLHTPQIVGFFDISVDHFEAYPLFAEYINKKGMKDLMAISSDTGFVKATRRFASLLDCPMGIIDKRRPMHNKAEIVNIIGDVQGKNCILLDDIVDTGGTIAAAADALTAKGAKQVFICATHPVLSEKATEKLEKCSAAEVIFTDTIPIQKERMSKKFKIISVAELMAQVIERIHEHKSLGELFSWEEKGNGGSKREE